MEARGLRFIATPQRPWEVRGHTQGLPTQEVLLVQASAPIITPYLWFTRAEAEGMKGKAEKFWNPPEQGNSPLANTGGEKDAAQPSPCAKLRVAADGEYLLPEVERRDLPCSPCPSGSHTHAHRHTQLRHQTQGSEDQDSRAGEGEKEVLVSQCACHP